jgi:hypothetical protein
VEDPGKGIWLTKRAGGAKIAKNGTVVFIKEDIVDPYICMGYAKAVDMAKCIGKITVPANPMKLSGNFILRQRVISMEINSLRLIGINGFYNVRVWPSLKQS